MELSHSNNSYENSLGTLGSSGNAQFIPLFWEHRVQWPVQGNTCAPVYFNRAWASAEALPKSVWGSRQ